MRRKKQPTGDYKIDTGIRSDGFLFLSAERKYFDTISPAIVRQNAYALILDIDNAKGLIKALKVTIKIKKQRDKTMRQKAAKLINKHAQISGTRSKTLKKYWMQTPRPLRKLSEILMAIADFKIRKANALKPQK